MHQVHKRLQLTLEIVKKEMEISKIQVNARQDAYKNFE